VKRAIIENFINYKAPSNKIKQENLEMGQRPINRGNIFLSYRLAVSSFL